MTRKLATGALIALTGITIIATPNSTASLSDAYNQEQETKRNELNECKRAQFQVTYGNVNSDWRSSHTKGYYIDPSSRVWWVEGQIGPRCQKSYRGVLNKVVRDKCWNDSISYKEIKIENSNLVFYSKCGNGDVTRSEVRPYKFAGRNSDEERLKHECTDWSYANPHISPSLYKEEWDRCQDQLGPAYVIR